MGVVACRPRLRWRTWAVVQVEEGFATTKPAATTRPDTARAVYNNIHEFYRNRVEQIVDVVESHRLFAKGVYRGNTAHLFPLVAIVGHVTALELRTRQHFETWGPWQHHY